MKTKKIGGKNTLFPRRLSFRASSRDESMMKIVAETHGMSVSGLIRYLVLQEYRRIQSEAGRE